MLPAGVGYDSFYVKLVLCFMHNSSARYKIIQLVRIWAIDELLRTQVLAYG